MKKSFWIKAGLALCLAVGLLVTPAAMLPADAAEDTTVHGKVISGTTADMLLLMTDAGRMEIKMDSSTDTSGARILLPGTELSVRITYGSDAYWHALRLSTDGQVGGVTVDSSKVSNVTGTINAKTTGDVLYVDTQQGEMQIKYDSSTNIQCSVLVENKKYTISCARGSDAYMHAISITEAAGQTSTSQTAAVSAASGGTATNSFSGTITKNTTESILFLSTGSGVMEFKIDSDANTSSGMINVAGNYMTVGGYRGNDGYWHAVSLTGVKEGCSANINTGSTINVSGTVSSKSTEKVLYLDTNGGMMELKLDAVRSINNFKVLTVGKKVNVTCGYGSDEYWHALDLSR